MGPRKKVDEIFVPRGPAYLLARDYIKDSL
jgi:hypothetical protein